MKRILSLLSVGVILAGCVTSDSVKTDKEPDMKTSPSSAPSEAFMANLSSLCGKSYEGRVVSQDEVDADWRAEKLTMHVRDCTPDAVKIPLHVGENRSRTWIVSKTETGLSLKHDHRHEDGTSDSVTMYGGETNSTGTATRQAFPADNYSKDLFKREFLTASVDNIWTIDIDPGNTFTYSLARPERDFRAEFDLTKPIDTPPPVWGYKK